MKSEEVERKLYIAFLEKMLRAKKEMAAVLRTDIELYEKELKGEKVLYYEQ